jgi:hypothetical protein
MERNLHMRRDAIYPHRSVRSFPISRLRFFTALGMAILINTVTAYFSSFLLAFHSQLSGFIIKCVGIATAGVRTIEIFPHLDRVLSLIIPFAPPRSNPLHTGVLFALAVMGLIVIHRSVPLSRNFVVFLIILICSAGAVIVFNPSFYFDSAMYEQMWLRGEMLVWFVLPWVSAFLFGLTLPSVAGGIAWTLLLQIYAFFWSALRLAFCLGILHYTGILFLPLLWFCMGVLFDLVYVLVFYSLALRVSMNTIIGERE